MNPAFDPKTSERVFQQFLDLWIIPEMKKRIGAGVLPVGFSLTKAQVVMYPDERKPVVRLNEEVQAIARVKAARPLRAGEEVREKDISEVTGIELTSEDDPNAGHLTGILFRREWVLVWDFRYSKGRAKQFVEAAREFLNAAKSSLRDRYFRPFVDNMYSAFELLATAQLLIIPDLKYTKKQTHASTQMRYNSFVKLGNYRPEYATAMNKLSGQRESARGALTSLGAILGVGDSICSRNV